MRHRFAAAAAADSPKLRNKGPNAAAAAANRSATARNSMFETPSTSSASNVANRRGATANGKPRPASTFVVVAEAPSKQRARELDPDLQRIQVSLSVVESGVDDTTSCCCCCCCSAIATRSTFRPYSSKYLLHTSSSRSCTTRYLSSSSSN